MPGRRLEVASSSSSSSGGDGVVHRPSGEDATSGAAPEADMERFFRPAGTGSGERSMTESERRKCMDRSVDENERKKSVDQAWQALQREQHVGRAWEAAEETARRREKAIAEEQERIRREREEQFIAAELGRQRRLAEEQERVRLTRETQEREAAAETLRQANEAARAKAQAKYMPRGPRGMNMGFGHYHNWTYEAVWNHDKAYCEWAMRENLTSSRRSQKLIQFAEWCVRRQQFGPMDYAEEEDG